jgi:hypothetical protein
MNLNSNISRHHPVIELIHAQNKAAEKVDIRLGQADFGRTAMQAVAGGRSYRSYSALSDAVGLNKAGSLRGMVVSAKWQTLFRYISRTGKYMENFGYLAAVSSEIANAAPQFEAILDSSDPAILKGMRLSAIASTIAQRALIGVVPAGAHIIYRSLEGWCMAAGLAGGVAQAAASNCISTLRYADTLVHTTFRTLTDTGNQSKAVWWVIDIVTSTRLR